MISRPSLVFTAALALPVAAQIPAFPGAQGFGANATGGRGGDVYYVTTLNNNGAGSLREGLNTAPTAGRTIVFAVSGYIPVVSDTNFNVPSNVTIAGQTAPGDGVGLRGGRMLISGSNVVMRHFRIRHGKNGTGGDCLNIANTASSTMLDHISLMFSTDENFSFFNSSVNNFTMQYSNSTWGMERHNAGGLWDLQNGSCHHTLWAHHRTRNPKARPNGVLEWINNVTFHWRNEGFIMGDSQSPANWKANVRGCYYISIDDADSGSTVRSTGLTKAYVASNGVPNFSLYLDDTLYDYDDNGVLDGTNRGYGIVSGSEFVPGDAVGTNRYYKSSTPFTGATGSAAITVDEALTGYKKVISSSSPLRLDANHAGPLRDELDSLLVDSVVNQYSILVQKDGKVDGEDPARTNNGEQLLADQYGITNNGFGTLNGTTPPVDSDLDGMPDAWEVSLNGKNGIAYNVAADDHNNAFTAGQLPNTFFPANTPVGYTLLEEYLHFLAIPHATISKNTQASPSQQTINLAKYTSAFTNTPAFTLTGVTNGVVQQFLADGTTPSATGPVVKFTPTTDFIGRAGFSFTVTDADGSQWTQQFALLVSGSTVPRDLTWIGGNAANAWDSSTSNWWNGSSATTFGDGDRVLFDDRGSASPAIHLQGSLVVDAMTVTGTKNFTFTGPGSLTSVGTLTKAGDTTLTLSTPFSFAGGTFLNGGLTVINNGGNLSGGAIQFSGGSTLTANNGSSYLTISPDIKVAAGAVGNINLAQRADLNGSLSGGGTFNIFSPSTLGTEGRVYLNGTTVGCTGTVNLSGGATAPGNAGRIAFKSVAGSFNGFDNARVNLSGIDLFTSNGSGGNIHAIGRLGGDANSRMRGSYSGGTTTWAVGGLGGDSTYAGEIMNGTSTTSLTKTGTGTLTLSGANSYTGATSVNSGTLRVTGSLGNTAVTVAGGATLSGTATLGGSLSLSGGSTVSPGNNPGETGTLTVANGLTLASGVNLRLDLTSNPNGANDQIIVQAGSLSQTGTFNFAFNPIDGYIGAGTYFLVTGAPNSSASGVGFTHNLPANTRQSFTIARSSTGAAGAKSIWLAVGGTAGNLTWTGSTSSWDIANTTPWTGGPSGDNRFFNLDTVTFGDNAANRSVTLATAMEPAQVIVNNNGSAYTFNGGGSLAGATVLIKRGSGALNLANTAAYSHTGGTEVEAGTLAISGGSALLGSADIRLKGGTLALPADASFLSNSIVVSANSAISSSYGGNSTILNSTSSTLTSSGEPTLSLAGVSGILSINGAMGAYSGTIAFDSGSGMLRLNSNSSGSNDVNFGSASAHFDLGSGAATLANRNGNISIHIGALTGGPNTHLNGRQSGSGSTATTYIIGGKNLTTVFSGAISHAGDLAGLTVIKTGFGSLGLAGNSNFTGSIGVEQGTLEISGSSVVSGDVRVDAAAALTLTAGTLGANQLITDGPMSGSGTLQADWTAHNSITGRGFTSGVPGILQVNGSANFDGGTLKMLGGIQSDRIQVSGDLSLEAVVQVALSAGTSFGRYPLLTCGGSLSVGSVALTGIPGGITAHLSTSTAGHVDLVIDDSDEDSLPDSWENLHFGNLSSGPTQDNDGDGSNNQAEFRLNLDPADGSSAFRAISTGQGLSWPSAPGLVFTVMRSLTLETGSWQNVATVIGPAASSTASWTDPAAFGKAFYQVEFTP